jgi:DNA-binding transcriptional LysR family regulator
MQNLLDLNQLQLFVVVADAKNFSKAAVALDIPRSTVSKRIAALEGSLGVQLFSRTTRQVMLTEAGRSLHSQLAPRLQEIGATLSGLTDDARGPQGPIRLTAPVDVSALLLPETLGSFVRSYPKVRLDLRVSNATKDLVAERVDVAIRVWSSRQRDSSLVIRRLADVSAGVFASPHYLAREGTPTSTRQAAQHRWISYSPKPIPAPLHEPKLKSALNADDTFFILRSLSAGLGLGLLPEFVAQSSLESGALVRVLPELRVSVGALYFVHAPMQHVPRKLVALREHLVAHFRQRSLCAIAALNQAQLV